MILNEKVYVKMMRVKEEKSPTFIFFVFFFPMFHGTPNTALENNLHVPVYMPFFFFYEIWMN